MSGLPSSFIAKKGADGSPSTSYITRIVPVANGNAIYSGDTVHFKIPGMAKNQFLDTANSVLKFRLKNNAKDYDFVLGKIGAPCVFRSVTLQQSGATLSQFQEYAVHRTMDFMKNVTEEAIAGPLNTLVGTKDVTEGETLGAGGQTEEAGKERSRVFCDPIKNYASLFNCPSAKYVPLFSRDSLDLIIELGDFQYGGRWASRVEAPTETPSNSKGLEMLEVELILSIVQLSPEVTQAHAKAHNGMYVFETHSYGLNQFSLTLPRTVETLNLGLGYTNVESLDFVMSQQNNDTTNANYDPKLVDMRSNFVKAGLTKYGFIIDGSMIEATREVTSSNAEALAMSLIGISGLDKAEHVSRPYMAHSKFGVEKLAGLTPLELPGAFIGSLDLCTYKNGRESSICSGRNTLSATTALQLTFGNSDALTGIRNTLFVFPKYRQILMLDLSGTGLFSVLQ